MAAIPNARFWIFWNGDWVKLTLKPNRWVAVSVGGPHEEGYSFESELYGHNGDGVECQMSSRGRDCDGPYERYSDFFCPLDQLKAVEADDEGRPPRPAWDRRRAYQRDIYAEMAGY